jgi:hypothetical protein
MNCPSCHETVEAGAVYCGNCGQPIQARQRAAQPRGQRLPAYALPNPIRQANQLRATVAVLLGIAGITGSIFIPILGLTLGTAGLVAATSSGSTAMREKLMRAGLMASAMAIAVGLAIWAYNVQHDPRYNKQVVRAEALNEARAANSLSTPCYSLDFIDRLNIEHQEGSCEIGAYNGKSLDTSTNAYKILATNSDIADVNTFMTTAKRLIEEDASKNLPGYTIDRQRVGSFAGSPAYIVNLSDKVNNLSIVQAAVMHRVGKGDNIFILVHANNGPEADLQILEAAWRWK